jgi:hypothetical protein
VHPEETPIARQQLGKQISAARGTQETTEEFLRTTFYIPSVHSGYKEEFS